MQQKRPMRKFIAINSYIRKKEKPQINILTVHIKELIKKKEQTKPEVRRKKEITKIRKK